MATTTDVRYSRTIHLAPEDLQPGDQVDLAIDHVKWPDGAWQTVTGVTECAEDTDPNCECEGDCESVVLLVPVEDGDLTAWHLSYAEAARLRVRVPAS